MASAHVWAAALGVAIVMTCGCGSDSATSGPSDAVAADEAGTSADTGVVGGDDSATAGDTSTAGDSFAACKSVADCPQPSAPCRSMSCQPNVGCVELQLVDGAICDTGDPCILAGQCKLGACVAGPVRDCDDDVACTSDSCKDGTC